MNRASLWYAMLAAAAGMAAAHCGSGSASPGAHDAGVKAATESSGSGSSSGAGSSSGSGSTGRPGSSSGSSSGAGSRDAGPPLTAASFPSAWAGAACLQEANCQEIAAAYAAGACPVVTLATVDFPPYGIATELDAGRVAFDPDAAAACVSALDSDAGCSYPAVCGAVYVPRVALGSACTSTADCIDSSCVGPNADAASCVANAQAGQSCVILSCAAPLQCLGFQVCVQMEAATASGPCGLQDGGVYLECSQGQFCPEQSADGGPPRCTPATALGGTCGLFDPPCGQGVCVPDNPTGTCRVASGPGGGCVADAGGSGCVPGFACGNSGCLLGLACHAGTCTVPPTSGPCGPSDSDLRCALGYYCDAQNTCQPQLPNGSPCDATSTTQTCLGTCATLPDGGGACSP